MDIISLILTKLSFIWEVGIPFLVALTLLVFVHELGHYLVAKWCKVKVEVFSIGFGPELYGWNDKAGTRWKISAIPLGGYVKMFGESETVGGMERKDKKERSMTAEEQKVSFYHKTLLQRASIVFAGPLINFIFAIFAFAILFLFVGVPQVDTDRQLAIVGNVLPNSSADVGGLVAGDQIVKIDENTITYFKQLQKIIRSKPNTEISVIVLRRGKNINLKFRTGSKAVENSDGEVEKIGLLGISVRPSEVKYSQKNPIEAIWLGFERTYLFTIRIFVYLGDIITAKQSADQLGGVLRIAQISGQVAELGVASFISFLAVLSINLGLINLFPIPLLDGGHLAFYAIEAIRGRPLGQKAQEYGFRIGLGLVGGLFLFVTWNDLVYLKFFETITKILT
jgi:regulator of sigma E protease